MVCFKGVFKFEGECPMGMGIANICLVSYDIVTIWMREAV